MTDPPLQSFLRFIAIDIHKHYLMIGAIDAHKQVVLPPRRVELSRWPQWAQANLLPTDAVVIEATTNAWAIYDLLAPLVGRAVVVHPAQALGIPNRCRVGMFLFQQQDEPLQRIKRHLAQPFALGDDPVVVAIG